MTWGEIKASGTRYYETIIDGSLCRFYQHPNGNWSCRMHGVGAMAIICEASKRELWDEVRRIARNMADLPAHCRPNKTEADIRRYGGTPGVAFGTAR